MRHIDLDLDLDLDLDPDLDPDLDLDLDPDPDLDIYVYIHAPPQGLVGWLVGLVWVDIYIHVMLYIYIL